MIIADTLKGQFTNITWSIQKDIYDHKIMHVIINK